MRALFLVLASLLAVSACSSRQLLNATASDSGYTLSQNVVYDDSTGLKLDVYAPEGAANAPVVVFFYGGSWQADISKDRSTYKFVGQALAAQGYVVMIPDYRLYPQVKYPDFLYDCAEAVKWAHDNAPGYGGDAGNRRH